jgi:hypothetical protein
MSIKHLIITVLSSDYNAEYITRVFWRENIAIIDSITFVPMIYNGLTGTIYSAYINIKQWCESESAYYFISHLKGPQKMVRLNHVQDEMWDIYQYENNIVLDGFSVICDIFYDQFNLSYLESDDFGVEGANEKSLTLDQELYTTCVNQNADISYTQVPEKKIMTAEDLIEKYHKYMWNIKSELFNNPEDYDSVHHYDNFNYSQEIASFDQYKQLSTNIIPLKPLGFY